MKGTLAVKTYLREIEGLGEFMCVFRKNTIFNNPKKYYVEVYWNFIGWSDGTNFEIGYPVDDIDKEIQKFDSEEGLKDFINHARITSECKLIDNASISLGAYEDLLRNYFLHTDEQINHLYEEGIVDRTFDEDEMDEFYDIFNGVLYTKEIKPKEFLIRSLEYKTLGEHDTFEKIESLNDLEAEILLDNIYGYLEDLEESEDYTEEEKQEILEEIAKEQDEEYWKLHTRKCKKCGKDAHDVAPNGAGIVEQSSGFSCDYCGWDENIECEGR